MRWDRAGRAEDGPLMPSDRTLKAAESRAGAGVSAADSRESVADMGRGGQVTRRNGRNTEGEP
jgi:hypothetical protein